MRFTAIWSLLAALSFCGIAKGTPRHLLQALPPNARFGGPTEPLDSLVVPGTTAKINWRGVGTQNYSSGADSQYAAAGATANMFLQNGTLVGKHFFTKFTDGSTLPAFTRNDATGKAIGLVIGRPAGSEQVPRTNDDGGYGSVPQILLNVVYADGFFNGVTHVQRINTLGGVVPGNPKLFTLPASPSGAGNFDLCVPYQADYLFLVPGSPNPPASG